MKRVVQLIICLCSVAFAKAADGDYAVSKIPAALLKANVVKRNEEIRFEVVNVNKVKQYKKVVYTVMNEKGDQFSSINEVYDKLSNQPSISGALYDAMGFKVKSLKRSEIADVSGGGGGLIDDNRAKSYDFHCKNYPYTIEYEVEQELYFTMFFPTWEPVEKEGMSVENSTISIVIPVDLHFRYKAFNYGSEPAVNTIDNKKVSTWRLQNFVAIEREYAAPRWQELTPSVYFAPIEFAIEGYEGTMNSWQDLGKFQFAINKGRDVLPDDVRIKVHQLTDGIADTHKRIEVLYNFMQKNTHYISIQLGIGGWQPLDANYVGTKRYGDCKALSNYMYSLLKEAGIKSYYTLIKAEDKFFLSDFPSRQSNHVILCVPLAKDTVWLECTSQTAAAGYMGSFTGDHYALLITEQGGVLVKTPAYKVNDNVQVRRISAVIDENGNAAIHGNGTYKAIEGERLHDLVNEYSKDKQLEILKKEFDLPQYDVVSFDYKEDKQPMPVMSEDIQLTASNYATITGRRLFVMPNILSKASGRLIPDTARKYDVVADYEYHDIDTVEIKIPEGYTSESVPQPQQIISKFGKYSSAVKVDSNKIIYYRSMERYSGRFPPAAYSELVKFYEQVYKADRNKVVMVKAN